MNQEIQNNFIVEPFKANLIMTGNLYYDRNGERWTILDFHSEIKFSSERGLKLKSQRIWKTETCADILELALR